LRPGNHPAIEPGVKSAVDGDVLAGAFLALQRITKEGRGDQA
jgi:hypothetical protein